MQTRFATGFLAASLAASASAAAGTLPTQAQVQAAMQRSFGYDPGVSWQILDIKPSDIPDMADVLVSMNKHAPLHLFVSERGQYAILGQVIPFGADPFAAARAKLAAADGPNRGDAQPAIKMVVFYDMECAHCAAAQPVLDKLHADFPAVEQVYEPFPLPESIHPWAMKAASYASCIGGLDPQAFWTFLDKAYESQAQVTADTLDSRYQALAQAAGLDADKLQACIAAPGTTARIKTSLELGKSLDITSVPTVFINGRAVTGITDIPYENLKGLVQFEIAHANK